MMPGVAQFPLEGEPHASALGLLALLDGKHVDLLVGLDVVQLEDGASGGDVGVGGAGGRGDDEHLLRPCPQG